MPEREVKKPIRNELSPDMKSSMKKRILYAIGIVAIFVPCLILGGYFYMSLMILVIGVATYEMSKVPGHKYSVVITITTFIIVYALIFWTIIKSNWDQWDKFDINLSFKNIFISPIAIAVMIGIFFLTVIFKEDFVVTDAVYLITMTLVISLGFQGLLYIRYIPFASFTKDLSGFNITTNTFKYFQSTLLIFYLLIAICFNDIGAYFVGVFFGKHKMAPRISPKKTWEGFFGGAIISFAFSSSFALILAACGYPMLPRFNLNCWYWIVLCSVLLPFFGNLGDFAFSAIKREYQVKDYSNILGPHGGILDRFDSALFGALALAILVTFINNDWSFLL